MRVQSLHIYPVKGARVVNLERARVVMRGLAGDRRWLVTDDKGAFLSQRNYPALAQIGAALTQGGLRLVHGADSFAVARPDGARRAVTVWNDVVDAADAGDEAANWLSRALGRSARLCYMDEQAARTTSGRWGPQGPVSFADSHPVLITTRASLAALNDAVVANGGAPAAMARFRPGIVIDGTYPWAEDCWKRIRIGALEFALEKPCGRCIVTTLDPETGEKTGVEPLRTLQKMRRSAHPDLVGGALFGWNAAPCAEGDIAVGDRVEVFEERPEGWPLA